MSDGGKSPKNEWAIEKENIPYANKLYEKHGHKYHRDNEHSHDVVIDGMRCEEKFRQGNYDDILIELAQDLRGLGTEIRKALGWFYTENMAYLHYFMGCEDGKGPQFFYRFNWPKLKKLIWEKLEDENFHRFQTSSKGYGLTLNLIVKIEDIPKDLYQKIKMR